MTPGHPSPICNHRHFLFGLVRGGSKKPPLVRSTGRINLEILLEIFNSEIIVLGMEIVYCLIRFMVSFKQTVFRIFIVYKSTETLSIYGTLCGFHVAAKIVIPTYCLCVPPSWKYLVFHHADMDHSGLSPHYQGLVCTSVYLHIFTKGR